MSTDATDATVQRGGRFGPAAGAGVAVLTLVLAFVAGQVVALGAGLAIGGRPGGAATSLLVLLADAVTLGIVLLVARRWFALGDPAAFGFRRTRPWPAIGWTVLALFSTFVISTIWGLLLRVTDVQDAADTLLRGGGAERIVAVVVIAVLAPIIEEVLFRGFLFTALRRWIGVWPAAAAVGVLFALAHLGSSDLVALLPLAVLGFLACALYWITGSLLAPIALHCLQNALAATVGSGLPLGSAPVLMVAAVGLALLIVAPFSRAARLPSPLAAPSLAAQEQTQYQPGDHGGGQ